MASTSPRTAAAFRVRLAQLQAEAAATSGSGTGRIPMRRAFDLAREFTETEPEEIDRLLGDAPGTSYDKETQRTPSESVTSWPMIPSIPFRRLSAAGFARQASGIRPAFPRFLDEHAATMPRTTLRYAIEHLDPETRSHYRQLRPTDTAAQQ